MSIASDDGVLCVDFFERPGGGFGFEQFRSDPEDGGRWTAVGGHAGTRYSSMPDAADAGFATVGWLQTNGSARSTWESWRSRC